MPNPTSTPTATPSGAPDAQQAQQRENVSHQKERCKGVTIVAHSGDFDKLMAAFIVAVGAAASGKPVTMFFTFWGLNALKNGKKVPGKTFLERMVSWMMPTTPNGAPSSRMNMFGIGPKFFSVLMRRNHVQPLNEMVNTANELGIRMVACRMSMGIMGIREAELVDDIDYGGVATYLCDAENANLNLFI